MPEVNITNKIDIKDDYDELFMSEAGSDKDLNEMVDDLFNIRKGSEYPGQVSKKRRIRLSADQSDLLE